MKQILQTMSDGRLRLEDVPAPALGPGRVLVRTAFSLISAGTERMKVETARMNLLQKALARPDQVQQVVATVQQQGIRAAYDKVRAKLEAFDPLGYSLSGTVIAVAPDVSDIRPGDSVSCGGQGAAGHAEIVSVPRNLCVRVPEGVRMEHAACATVGAIALHGVHQAALTTGDVVVVIGLGLIGQMAAQLAAASGAMVVGIDVDEARAERALRTGARASFPRDDPALERRVLELSAGRGADAVLIAAGGRSADPVALAGKLARDRGRVVVVGLVHLDLPWEDFYRKELSLILSRSYGPGRYDPKFEEGGADYPVGYVPYTERRNMEAFLSLVADRRLALDEVLTHTLPVEDALDAFALLEDPAMGALGVLLSYPASGEPVRTVELPPRRFSVASGMKPAVGVIGAGSFCTGTLLPALAATRRAEMRSVCSASGVTAKAAAHRFGFRYAVDDTDAILSDPEIVAVVIATRHDTHASLVARALRADKRVFVEKPLAIREDEISDVAEAAHAATADCMVGFNRRFAPAVGFLRMRLRDRAGPAFLVYRVNAGHVPATHWTLDPDVGGGRIVGEACHFIDAGIYLTGERIETVFAQSLRGHEAGRNDDNASVVVGLSGGSILTVHYIANGNPRMGKEHLEVFADGCSYQMDNFRRVVAWEGGRGREERFGGGSKGHREEMAAWVDSLVRGEPSPIPLDEAIEVTLATFAASQSMAVGQVQRVTQVRNGSADPLG